MVITHDKKDPKGGFLGAHEKILLSHIKHLTCAEFRYNISAVIRA